MKVPGPSTQPPLLGGPPHWGPAPSPGLVAESLGNAAFWSQGSGWSRYLGRGGGTNSEKPHSPHRQCQPHTRKRPEIDPNTPSPWQQPRGFCWRGVLQDTAPTGHPPAALPHQAPSGCRILRLRGSKLGEGTRQASSWGSPPTPQQSLLQREGQANNREKPPGTDKYPAETHPKPNPGVVQSPKSSERCSGLVWGPGARLVVFGGDRQVLMAPELASHIRLC